MTFKIGILSVQYMVILGGLLLLTGFALADDVYLIALSFIEILFGFYLIYNPTKFGASVCIPVFVSAVIGILLTRPIYDSVRAETYIDVALLALILFGMILFLFFQIKGRSEVQ